VLSVIAYNLGNLWRRLVLPKRIGHWSLTSLQQRLVMTGGRLVKHARYYWLLLAESHLTRRLFGAMIGWIESLPLPSGLSPQPAGENLEKQARGRAGGLRNRMGNGSRCRLTPSRRRTPGCQMARWHLECQIAFANGPEGFILLWLRMPKWKSWLGRFAQASEIASAIAFLASDGVSFLTGTCLMADGGYTAL
jgi:hypothetical protein